MALQCLIQFFFITILIYASHPQRTERRVGNLKEVFAWRQITYDIDGILYDQDTAEAPESYQDNDQDQTLLMGRRPKTLPQNNSFYTKYINVPMGIEKVDNRLFITVSRRGYGIPSTLNYVDLTQESYSRSPPLKPYPNLRDSRSLVSVYRTTADRCGRLWMVDTGLLEAPNAPRQLQPPSIVVFDLKTDKQILKYELKSSDIISAATPGGLSSITVDVQKDCSDTYAYIPDLATFGVIVYSLKDNDSWRFSHNFFYFSPTSSTFNVGGQRFQWGYGISTIALSQQSGNCRTAYFHAMAGTEEYSVSTCVWKNKTSSQRPNYWELYSFLGYRGIDSQSIISDFHEPSRVIFYGDIGRDSLSCWHSGKLLNPSNVAVLARDSVKFSNPSDLDVIDNEVWVIVNSLPRFRYSVLDTNEYNFFVYRANVQDLIKGTICDGFVTG